MSEMPTCTTCGLPHWRFKPCAEAPALAAKEAAATRERERLKVQPELKCPPGFVRVGHNKFARDVPRDGLTNRPSFVQIAPGKYRKAA